MKKSKTVKLAEQMQKVEEQKFMIFNEKIRMIVNALKKDDTQEYHNFIEKFQKFAMGDPDWTMFVDEEYEALFGSAA